MNWLKALCEGEKNEYIHKQFTRFGKGEYERFLLSIKKGKKNLQVKTSFDLANLLVWFISQNVDEDLAVSGKIIANYDFESEVESVKFSKRGKLYTAELNTTMSQKALQELFEKFKMYHLLLTIKGSDVKMKAKGSLPKPGGALKDNFCSATLPLDLLKDLAFDIEQEFTKAVIVHRLLIDDVVVPEAYKDDAAAARLHAIRKGKLIREIDLDGTKVEKEYALEV